MVALQRWSFH